MVAESLDKLFDAFREVINLFTVLTTKNNNFILFQILRCTCLHNSFFKVSMTAKLITIWNDLMNLCDCKSKTTILQSFDGTLVDLIYRIPDSIFVT